MSNRTHIRGKSILSKVLRGSIVISPKICPLHSCCFDPYVLVWFNLFNGISTSPGLFNAKICFICKCFILILTIFSMFHLEFFKNCTYLSLIISLPFYGFKYSI